MHKTRLRAVGGSVMVAIPKPVLEALDLAADTPVGLRVEKGRLVVDPRLKRRYKLAELMAQCDLSAKASREERAWVDGGPVGRELI